MRAAFSTCIAAGAAHTALAWAPYDARYHHRRLASTMSLGQKHKEPVATSWFASWNAKDFPLSDISWPKYTNIGYSFGLTTPNVNFVNISDPDVFKDFVSTAHANSCSASLTLGGWTGSQYFSTAVGTAENRTAFVKTLSTLVHEHQLDGLDFDWEYPYADGIGCNTKSPNDTANFLAFLTELRTALPDTTLTAAAAIVPFSSADGTPSTDVSEFASVLDYIAIMNYDIWGPWSDTVGPNAPLNDTCVADPSEKVGSAVSAIHAWTAAGIPPDQLVLGVAAYGHSYVVAPSTAISNSSNTLVPYPAFNKSAHPQGDAWDTIVPYDVCGNPEVLGGNWNFWGLIEGGFLNKNGTVNSAGGIMYRYDECSQTPYVYNRTSEIMVSYDDATSFAAKGHFIKSLGLRGFAMWETGGDYHDILLDSIRSAADFPKRLL